MTTRLSKRSQIEIRHFFRKNLTMHFPLTVDEMSTNLKIKMDYYYVYHVLTYKDTNNRSIAHKTGPFVPFLSKLLP